MTGGYSNSKELSQTLQQALKLLSLPFGRTSARLLSRDEVLSVIKTMWILEANFSDDPHLMESCLRILRDGLSLLDSFTGWSVHICDDDLDQVTQKGDASPIEVYGVELIGSAAEETLCARTCSRTEQTGSALPIRVGWLRCEESSDDTNCGFDTHAAGKKDCERCASGSENATTSSPK